MARAPRPALRGLPARHHRSVTILTLLTFATDQASVTDLALTQVLLNLPGTLLMAVFLERWI